MKRENIFKTVAAAVFAATMVLAGCDKSPEVQVPETPDWSNLRFVVSATNVDGLGAQGAQTRALKTGWADGDKIIAYLTPDAANYVTLQYDLETDEWSAIAAGTNVDLDGIATSGNAVKALHSGKGVEREDSGILNVDSDTDLLYDDAGEYTIDATDPANPVARLTLTMSRGATTAIVVKFPAGSTAAENAKWWLWSAEGDLILVQEEGYITADKFTDGFTFGALIPDLFSDYSSASPDPRYTTDEQIVFHVVDKSGAGGTTLRLFREDNEDTEYIRTYPHDMAAGDIVTLGGPTLEPSEWLESTTGYDPAVENYRITWKEGRYALTTDPTDSGLYFKFGSVAGIFSGDGAVLTLPMTPFENNFYADDVAWSPVAVTNYWESVPYSTYYDANETVDAAYHTAANVKAGKGDPCRLVGLDLDKIKTTAADDLTSADIDNGEWRLPTHDENKTFSGYSALLTNTSDHLTTHNGQPDGVPGAMFPTVDAGNAGTFLPAAGRRDPIEGTAGNYTGGMYWSSSGSGNDGYILGFSNSTVNMVSIVRTYGISVRCVRQ